MAALPVPSLAGGGSKQAYLTGALYPLVEVCRDLRPEFFVKNLRRGPWTHLWKGAQRQASLALSFTACTMVFLRPDDWQVAFE